MDKYNRGIVPAVVEAKLAAYYHRQGLIHKPKQLKVIELLIQLLFGGNLAEGIVVSHSWLLNECGVGNWTVKKAIKDLEYDGIIHLSIVDGCNQPNTYYLTHDYRG